MRFISWKTRRPWKQFGNPFSNVNSTWMFGRGNKVFFINFNCVFLCLEHMEAGMAFKFTIEATFWGLQLTRLIQSLFDHQLRLRLQISKQHRWHSIMLSILSKRKNFVTLILNYAKEDSIHCGKSHSNWHWNLDALEVIFFSWLTIGKMMRWFWIHDKNRAFIS